MADQGRYSRGSGRQNAGSARNTGSGVSDETRRYDGGFLNGAQYSGYDDPGYSGNIGNPYAAGYSADYDPDGYEMYDDYDYDDYGYDQDSREAYPENDAWYANAGDVGPDGSYHEAYRRRSSGPSMAQRASGKANNEIYGRPGSRSRSGRAPSRSRQYEYDYDYEEPQKPARRRREKRRKKRHPLRSFLIFLLILAAVLAGAYFLLFRAPTAYEDDVHTRKSDFYNILLCATDEQGERTDTIMLLSIDQTNFTISLTTLPRDTIVDNGDSVPKLNGVYTDAGCGESGAEALMDQVKELLGFRPDGYMIVSYQVFRDAVDAMGGVWFDVPVDMTKGVDKATVTVSAGEQLLDGETALAVCRFRYGYLMQDIQRQYVQQEFIKAMIKQCMKPQTWTKLPAVYQAVMNNTITDLSNANMRFVGLWVALCYHNGMNQNSLPGEGCTYNGASCYGLYGQSTVNLVNEVMNPFEEEITLDDVDILTVSDGELVPSTSEGVAFDPSTYQYN